MLACELLVAVGQYALLDVQQRIVLSRLGIHLTPYLYQQTLLQIACPQTGGVKVLNDFQYLFQLLNRGVNARVDGQIVAQVT